MRRRSPRATNKNAVPPPVRRRACVWAAAAVAVLVAVVCIFQVFRSRQPAGADSSAAMVPSPPPAGDAPEGMAWVPGGPFWMGDEDYPDARPARRVEVTGFWMDRTEVTNARFAKFVEATGYQTVAEQTPDPRDFPGVPLEKLKPGSAVFSPAPVRSFDNPLAWWRYV